MLAPVIKFFTNPAVVLTGKIIYYASYFFIPFFLIILIWDLWLMYRRYLHFGKQTNVLLEIKLPKQIFKSPRAMEFCIAGLYQLGGEGNWYEKYWKGSTRSWFSLEIASIEGGLHFFIWTKKGHKNSIEANLYSQFPGIEIFEVPDYTIPLKYDPEVNTLWVSEFDLTKADAFPIKTYMDYGMDKDPKEEYKIDPLAPLIEFLGSVGKGHQVWIQIILRSHKAEDKDPETGKLIDARWAKAAEKEIANIIGKSKGEKGEDGKIIPGTGRPLTDAESETVKALGRSTSKSAFDVGIRTIYSAPKDLFNPGNIGGIIGGITHFNSHLNGFKPARGAPDKWKLLPWKNVSEKKKNGVKQDMLDAYKRRAYFYDPFKRPYFVLNTEELATIFHFPGGLAGTQTFSRIESKKAEAPSNIPT